MLMNAKVVYIFFIGVVVIKLFKLSLNVGDVIFCIVFYE